MILLYVHLLYGTEPFNTTVKAACMELWREQEPLDSSVHLNIIANEHLPAGAENCWTTWKALNRLRTQVGRSRVNMLKWGFSSEQGTCDCGIRQTMQHLLVCPMMNTACSTHELTTLMASPSAVPGIGRVRFDGHATRGGMTRMMMMYGNVLGFFTVKIYSCQNLKSYKV